MMSRQQTTIDLADLAAALANDEADEVGQG